MIGDHTFSVVESVFAYAIVGVISIPFLIAWRARSKGDPPAHVSATIGVIAAAIAIGLLLIVPFIGSALQPKSNTNAVPGSTNPHVAAATPEKAGKDAPDNPETPPSPNPLKELRAEGFEFTEDFFARSVKIGRYDITEKFLNAGFSPNQPIKTMAIGRPLTAAHLALQTNSPNICELFRILKTHGADLTSPKTTGFSAPVTLMDIALEARNERAIACLRPEFGDVRPYRSFVENKIQVMQLLDQPSPKDEQTLEHVLPDCPNDVKMLIARQEIIDEILYFGDRIKSSTLPIKFCLFRTDRYIKYLVDRAMPEQWGGIESYLFWRAQGGPNDDGPYDAEVSLRLAIETNKKILTLLN